MPGFTGGSWYGLLAPAGTPAPVVERLHAEVVSAFKSAEFRRTLEDLSILPLTSTPAELVQLIRSETDILRQLAARIGLEPE